MSRHYGLGVSGQAGYTVTDLGTIQHHAVLLPVPLEARTWRAVCHREVSLRRLAGWIIEYSLKDAALCPACKEVVLRTGIAE